MKKPLLKSNFLTSGLKTPVVLGESLGFFIAVSLDVFISSCFHFFRRFWVFLLLIAFVHFTVSSLLLLTRVLRI